MKTSLQTIVVVDDDPILLDLLRRILESRGYRVLTAVNGREGIETILKVRPHLILLDVLMPVVQGAEALRYLRSQNVLQDSKIILMSSLVREDFDRLSSERAEAQGYLVKPVDKDVLLETVAEVLENGHG